MYIDCTFPTVDRIPKTSSEASRVYLFHCVAQFAPCASIQQTEQMFPWTYACSHWTSDENGSNLPVKALLQPYSLTNTMYKIPKLLWMPRTTNCTTAAARQTIQPQWPSFQLSFPKSTAITVFFTFCLSLRTLLTSGIFNLYSVRTQSSLPWMFWTISFTFPMTRLYKNAYKREAFWSKNAFDFLG